MSWTKVDHVVVLEEWGVRRNQYLEKLPHVVAEFFYGWEVTTGSIKL
jgi:hypothetical protein